MVTIVRSMSALQAKNKFGQLIETAQREPVTITKQGRPTVVVMSVEDYERRRAIAKKQLLDTLDKAQAYAKSKGLSEDTLEKLLADES
jgi:prevent-host-death family protein